MQNNKKMQKNALPSCIYEKNIVILYPILIITT